MLRCPTPCNRSPTGWKRSSKKSTALDYVKSYTLAGESTLFVFLKSETRSADIPAAWYQVRKKISDVRSELPSGIQGPAFNDEFGDVFGSIYAFTADGLSFRQLRDYVEQVRADIRSVPNLGKIELLGAQREVIYLNFSIRKLAALGIDQRQVLQSLQAQNSVTPAGVIESGPERIAVRASGQFSSEEDLEAVNLRFGERFFRLSDLATIERRYADPPSSLFRFNGQPAIGLAVAMKQGGNIQAFGTQLQQRIDELTTELPLGIDVHLVSSQADVVEKAIGGFTHALFEAILIVLVVSFISLGIRAGLVVACSIPLVLALVFVFMEYSGITMQRISLGALIIALGLLVDDAMITVEMPGKRRFVATGRDLRLYLDGLPDADRHAGDGCRFRAHRPEFQFSGRIRVHHVRSHRRGPVAVLAGGGAVCATDWRAYPQGVGAACRAGALDARLQRPADPDPGAPLVGDRHHVAAVHRLTVCHQNAAEPVLSGLRPPGNSGGYLYRKTAPSKAHARPWIALRPRSRTIPMCCAEVPM
ncbi:Transporter, AcrB/AcrD/AcrF family [Pseudomonas amygdali pv. dendropanacis]|uniref:Transporter, AcrB/AcrD/AcrF family n=1 Tax=Pseudomonas amygdali pv. dendropanacis TaxID=235272 RepID=A0A0P9S3G0_PSEA0|nr:Transporter, AcrB/AcrD/AcrF family [Pseudomonas amygdali pv. dendropanacis]